MNSSARLTPLDSARRKAYRRILPVVFLAYVIAYVDRSNVAIAKLTMMKDLPGFDNAVIGFGAGVFFLGYFLLEIPGTLIVERWSARKWISRIMISWGFFAAATALVKTPSQFYAARFLLGLAEAGFFPGIIVYLTHWFPSRDRTRALSLFLIATPIAQLVTPKLSNALLKIGTVETVGGAVIHHATLWGLRGWQLIYIVWAIPAVVLGIGLLWLMTDHPRQARWLTPEERDALESELQRERAATRGGRHMTVLQALRHPRGVLLAVVYFLVMTGNYGVEFFLPSILQSWYGLRLDTLTWLLMVPFAAALVGQLFVGWSSDRFQERRWHAAVAIGIAAFALALATTTRGSFGITLALVIVAITGIKAFLPAFWSLPTLFLTEAAAASCIGLINSVGNLGGFVGPYVVGKVETVSGSFGGGMLFVAGSMGLAGIIVALMKVQTSARAAAGGAETVHLSQVDRLASG
jgi:MFS transporter, ACS family, tartrate transporter